MSPLAFAVFFVHQSISILANPERAQVLSGQKKNFSNVFHLGVGGTRQGQLPGQVQVVHCPTKIIAALMIRFRIFVSSSTLFWLRRAMNTLTSNCPTRPHKRGRQFATQMLSPPSMTKACPVMKAELFDARKTTPLAISSTVPKRPIGIVVSTYSSSLSRPPI